MSDNPVIKGASSKKKIIAIAVVLTIVLGGAAFFYFNGIQTAKTNFAAKCQTSVSNLSDNFKEYRYSSNKPNFLLDSGSSPKILLSRLFEEVNKSQKNSEENLRYSGAKKSLEAIKSYRENLTLFKNKKEKKLKLESSNPHYTALKLWVDFAEQNLVRSVVDKAFDRRLKDLGQKYEKRFDKYVSANFSSKDELELIKIEKAINADWFNFSNICREARG